MSCILSLLSSCILSLLSSCILSLTPCILSLISCLPPGPMLRACHSSKGYAHVCFGVRCVARVPSPTFSVAPAARLARCAGDAKLVLVLACANARMRADACLCGVIIACMSAPVALLLLSNSDMASHSSISCDHAIPLQITNRHTAGLLSRRS